MIEGPYLVTIGNPGLEIFGEVLQKLRLKANLTAIEFAKRANVHVSFIRGIERGAQAPSLQTARRLFSVSTLPGNHGIQWMKGGNCDVLIQHPDEDRRLAFLFKAEVQGQNRRSKVDGQNRSLTDERLRTIALEAAAITHHRDNTRTPEMVVQTANRYLRFLKEGE